MRDLPQRILHLLVLIVSVVLLSANVAIADGPKYSDKVVEKADKILEEHGLRRSGKNIQATETSTLSRTITRLAKRKRELRKVRQEWEQADQYTKQNRDQIRQLTVQDGNLNLQIARGTATSTAERNRLVGLINANRAKLALLRNQAEVLKKNADEKRSALSSAEADYAEEVLKLRKSFEEIESKVNQSLAVSDVQTALGVMTRNFEVSEEQSAAVVLKVLNKKLEKIEQAIFQEAIPLHVDRGSLYIDVVVGEKVSKMVVDSGATLISLPAKTAVELGIRVPSDAPVLRLVMADGSEIEGRRVTLKRVRVGNFEATDVEAAVLEASAISAEPLLGMSYFGNFKFEIDAAAKQLKMLRISAE